MKRYMLTLIPITPIHIGTGEEIEPLEYSVRDGMLYRHDMNKLLDRLTPRARGELQQLLDRRDLTALRSFLTQHATEDTALYSGPVSAEFEQLVGRGLRSSQSTLRVALATRCPLSLQPYIPGSSVKGALRTGYLYRLARDAHPNWSDDSRAFEATLLGYLDRQRNRPEIRNDPFRLVKISDSAPSPAPNRFYRVSHFNMGGTRQFAQMIDLREGTPALAVGQEVAYKLECTIPDEPRLQEHFGRHVVGLEQVLEGCDEFYQRVLEVERKYWKDHGQSQVLQAYQKALRLAKQRRDAWTGPAAYIRLGWGSGRDAVTLDLLKPEGRHPPRRMQPEARYEPKTRRAAEEKWPLGWALLFATALTGAG